MLVLQIYASNRKMGWKLLGSGATAAFLQGGHGTRKKRLFMCPPRGPASPARNCFPADLYKLVGNVYGLASAPLEWAREVISRMLGLGFQQHSVDHMLFVKLDENRKLMALGIFHADDLILAYGPQFTIQALLDAFTRGNIVYAPEVITFCGRQIHVLQDRAAV